MTNNDDILDFPSPEDIPEETVKKVIKNRTLSVKQRKFCNFYLNGDSCRAALLKSGYTDTYANSRATDILKNRQIQEYIRQKQKDLQDYNDFQAKDFYKLIFGKFIDPNVDEKSKTEYAKILQRMGGFEKELDLKLAQLNNEIKDTNINISFKDLPKDNA